MRDPTPGELNALAFYAIGVATEGGPTPQRLTVARNAAGQPAGNSGYSLGTLQMDLGQRGDSARYAIDGVPAARALIGQAAAWGAAHGGRGFSLDAGRMETALLSNHARGGLQELAAADRQLFNDWGDSAEGRQWIWEKIERPHVRELAGVAGRVVAATAAPGWNDAQRTEAAALVAKTHNQNETAGRRLIAAVEHPGATPASVAGRYADLHAGSRYLAGDAAQRAQGDLDRLASDPGMAALTSAVATRFADVDRLPAAALRDDPALRLMGAMSGSSSALHGLASRVASPAPDAPVEWRVADGSGGRQTLRYDDRARVLSLSGPDGAVSYALATRTLRRTDAARATIDERVLDPSPGAGRGPRTVRDADGSFRSFSAEGQLTAAGREVRGVQVGRQYEFREGVAVAMTEFSASGERLREVRYDAAPAPMPGAATPTPQRADRAR